MLCPLSSLALPLKGKETIRFWWFCTPAGDNAFKVLRSGAGDAVVLVLVVAVKVISTGVFTGVDTV